MHNFYLQHPFSQEWFDSWDVECLLSLLEIWAPAFSLTNWKSATLLVLVAAKLSFDLMYLWIDNQHPLHQPHAAIFVSVSGGKMDQLSHPPPQIGY